MPDSLQEQIPSPIQLRAQLEAMVRRDLLGPTGGPDEELTERVRDRYIVGLVAPRGQSILPDEQDDPAAGGDGEDQDGRTDAVALQTASMLPSSIGLTFTVDGDADAIQVVARWGHYRRMLSQTQPEPEDKPRLVWKRRQVEGVSPPLRLRPGEIGPWQPDPDSPEVYVRGLCRRSGACWAITLFLVNSQQEPKINKDEAWLFQPELIVAAPHGEPIFVKRQLPPELNAADPEDRAVEMLYRRDLEFAVGHGIAVHADLAPADLTGFGNLSGLDSGLDWQRAVSVRTEVMPAYEVERMEPPDPADVPPLADAITDMQTLAELAQGQFGSALAPLADAYAAWITAQEARLAAPAPDLAAYADVAAGALADCRAALGRMRAGIAVLDADPAAAQAFKFANRAMQLQRIRSIFAREARGGRQPDMEQIDVPANRTWRPFQLAFILLNLPALADPRHPDRSDAPTAAADLLWFPTGGGKTEAYLGVAAFTLAIRRLQGELGGLSGAAGVAVLMRYSIFSIIRGNR